MSATVPVTISDQNVAVQFIQAVQQHGVYKGEMPATPEEQVAKANELYLLAKQAQAGGMGNQPVLQQIVAIVEGQAQAAPPAPVAPQVANPFGGAAPTPPPVAPPVAAPPVAPPPAPAPVPVAPPAPPAAPVGVKIIKLDTGEIFELAPDQDPAPYVNSGQYSLAQDPEPPVAPPVAAPPEQAAPQAASPSGVPAVDPSQYKEVEPWQGYSTENLPPIIEKLTSLTQTQDPDTVKRILAHVWEYESTFKKRKRLLEKLQEFATGGSQPPAPGAVAPVAPPAEGADVQPQPPFQPPAPSPFAVPPVASAPVAPTPQWQTQEQAPSAGLIEPLQGTTQKSWQTIRAENLPIPGEIQGEAPVLPQDFTAVPDLHLAQYQSIFTACLGRANWLRASAEGHAADAKIYANGLMRQYKATNPAPKGTTVDQVEAAAHVAVPEIAHAQQVQSEWGGHAKLLEALCETYQENLVRLSREQSRRSDERAVAR